ncbi:archease [bacterium]|nr:archease [bacterium]
MDIVGRDHERRNVMDETSGFTELAHTADWALQVWGRDLEELMVTAIRGMYALSGMAFAEDTKREVSFSLEAFDGASLLVEFLNEVLFYAESESLGLKKLALQINGNFVQVEAVGVQILQRKKEIKAVTYHNLKIERSSRGLETVLIFDV